jgi:hypothetical protein
VCRCFGVVSARRSSRNWWVRSYTRTDGMPTEEVRIKWQVISVTVLYTSFIMTYVGLLLTSCGSMRIIGYVCLSVYMCHSCGCANESLHSPSTGQSRDACPPGCVLGPVYRNLRMLPLAVRTGSLVETRYSGWCGRLPNP